MHDDLVGKWQRASNGKLGANSGFLENRVITTKMAPFMIPATLTIASGDANKPSDFIYQLAIRINGKEVKSINHNQIATVNDSVIDPPLESSDTYYVVTYEDYYHFLPISVTEAELDYIAAPEDVVWAFTLNGQNRQVYDAANSVQPKWNQNTIIEITRRALKSLGVSFKDSDFAQYGTSVINTGD